VPAHDQCKRMHNVVYAWDRGPHRHRFQPRSRGFAVAQQFGPTDFRAI
jgi:hypothetical protein